MTSPWPAATAVRNTSIIPCAKTSMSAVSPSILSVFLGLVLDLFTMVLFVSMVIWVFSCGSEAAPGLVSNPLMSSVLIQELISVR